jgi:peroxiredoxin Q/BCP
MKTLKVGDRLPDFKVLDEQGNSVQLSDFKGKKLIVFFYPKASTPGCTMEACNLRDNYQLLLDKGYAIIGVSADSAKRQQNFKDKHEFPFPLIADEDKQLIDLFGVWGPKKFMGREYDGIHRMTFIVENAEIIKRIDKVKTKDHAAQILEEA